jgi:hypothetical protein
MGLDLGCARGAQACIARILRPNSQYPTGSRGNPGRRTGSEAGAPVWQLDAVILVPPSCSTRRSGTTRQSCPRARGFRVELESPRTKRAIPTCRVMSECVIPTCCRVATRDPTGGKQGMWTSERTHRARARASLALLRVLDSSTGTALPRSGC